MHHIFTFREILREIVIEYGALHDNTWKLETDGNSHRRHLLLLGTTAKIFLPLVLEILWRDVSLVRLSSIFDREMLAGDRIGFLESNSCICSIRVVLPTFGIDTQPIAMFHSLKASEAFRPMLMYCVPPSADPEAQEKSMERYAMLFKESLVDILLYVAINQSFMWGPVLSCLPKYLRRISILPMLPTAKDSESPPALSLQDTRGLLSACTFRGDTLRSVELQFLHLGMTSLVLRHLKLLPRLSTLLLASPRWNIDPSDEDGSEPLTIDEDTILEIWPSLRSLTIRGYLLDTADAILGACQSNTLTSLTIKTPLESISTPISRICDTVVRKWTKTLEVLEFKGPTASTDDPVVDVDHIVRSLTSLIKLKRLHIDCRHVLAHLHRQHLFSIGSQMHSLELIHLTSETDSTRYMSNLRLLDLAVLRPLPELLTVTMEIGQMEWNTSPVDEQYRHDPQTFSRSKVSSICVLSSHYDRIALGQCVDLFPKVTMIEYKYAPYVEVDSSGLFA